jgi:hypothetical protein
LVKRQLLGWWHISPPAYEKVELGMDEPEVVSILGWPVEAPQYQILLPVFVYERHHRLWFRPWSGDWIAVMFDDKGRVVGKVATFPGST